MEKSSAFQRWNNYMREQNEKAQKDHEEKLLLCPFCGGEAEYRVGNRYVTQCHYIQCRKCKAQTAVIDEGTYLIFDGKSNLNFTANTARQAVFENWNRRTQPGQSDVVHGRWETVELYGETARYQCTACKEEMIDSINREGYHRYCHKCGAKMEEAR